MKPQKPMKFQLVAPDNTSAAIVRHIEAWLSHMLSAFLEGYRVEVSCQEDQIWRRTKITTRIFFDDGIERSAISAFSYSWYHKDSGDNVKRKLEKHLIKFVEKTKPRLKPPEEVRRLAALRDLNAARKDKRDAARAEENALTIETELAALDRLLE